MLLLLRWWKNGLVGMLLALLALSAIGSEVGAANTIFFEDDFETCDYRKYSDVAFNQIDRTISHSGQCSSKIGGNSIDFGRLIVPLPGNQTELWFRGFVFFPSDFQLPVSQGDIHVGIHVWRFSNFDIQLDFGVAAGQATLQLFQWPGNTGGQGMAPDTGFNPIAGNRAGRWQCWELRSRLNQPGQVDGVVEFYAEGNLVGSFSGDFRGASSAGYTVVDVQSNIGGAGAVPPWPTTNWWYVDDVVVSTARVGCPPNVTDNTPPNPPGGLRVNVP
ncbi:MAG: hypothetical protein L0387_41250 [Acidobacteria bacterium]|nr:hypothetical protein [Acidobacteriota bacterium]